MAGLQVHPQIFQKNLAPALLRQLFQLPVLDCLRWQLGARRRCALLLTQH